MNLEPETGQVVIDVCKLTKQFGKFTAVDQVSFTVRAGEVVGYLGPNGSGKTTTIRMLLGLLRPTAGEARVLDLDIVRQSEQIRQQVGYMSQRFGLYHDLTIRENLKFYAGVYGVRNSKRLDEVLDLVNLRANADERVTQLASGFRQRLALATAIVHKPSLLFLDEPTSGVDPKARRAFWDLIYTVVDQGVTALVTTHYMDEAEYCGRVGIMRNGRLLALDTPSSLKESALKGLAWDIFAEPLMPGLNALEACPGVLRAGLAGDHLRAITHADMSADTLSAVLQAAGAVVQRLEIVQPTLEDIFLALAARSLDQA